MERNMLGREERLVNIATFHSSDKIANAAMKALREEFDETYGWCEDCDGLVCKEQDCCLNQPITDDNFEDEF